MGDLKKKCNKIVTLEVKFQNCFIIIFFTLSLPGYFVCLFDLILYVPSTIFQLYRDGSSWVEPVLS